VDEIDLQEQLLRSKIKDIIGNEFVKEINRFVHEEERVSCEGYEMDDPSQEHHHCLVRVGGGEGIWIYHYEMAKKLIRGSEWGLVFSVICPQFLVFAVKLANILMFTVFGENTV